MGKEEFIGYIDKAIKRLEDEVKNYYCDGDNGESRICKEAAIEALETLKIVMTE